MEILIQLLILIGGFILLIKGADWLISGASSVATHLKVSKMLIGLTIVAFGTSAPELAVSISSLITGNSDMLLGNVLGSNILNILLLVGVAALIRPLVIRSSTVRKELPMLLLISTALAVLFLDVVINKASENQITRSDGIICILFFGIFLYYLIAMAKHSRDKTKREKGKKSAEKPQYRVGISLLLTALGLAGVTFGSRLVVDSAASIAGMIGISERVISLTVIALGTSLPELVTIITAAKRREQDMIIGNIVGSNIFNICLVLGFPIAIFGTVTPDSFKTIDLVMFIGSAILLFLFARTDRKITRLEGGLMIAAFAIYYCIIIMEGFTV